MPLNYGSLTVREVRLPNPISSAALHETVALCVEYHTEDCGLCNVGRAFGSILLPASRRAIAHIATVVLAATSYAAALIPVSILLMISAVMVEIVATITHLAMRSHYRTIENWLPTEAKNAAYWQAARPFAAERALRPPPQYTQLHEHWVWAPPTNHIPAARTRSTATYSASTR